MYFQLRNSLLYLILGRRTEILACFPPFRIRKNVRCWFRWCAILFTFMPLKSFCILKTWQIIISLIQFHIAASIYITLFSRCLYAQYKYMEIETYKMYFYWKFKWKSLNSFCQKFHLSEWRWSLLFVLQPQYISIITRCGEYSVSFSSDWMLTLLSIQTHHHHHDHHHRRCHHHFKIIYYSF